MQSRRRHGSLAGPAMRGMVILRLACVLLLGVLLPGSASAQWRQLNSPSKESLRGLAVAGNLVWASGTHGTYLLSQDKGETWKSAQVPGAEGLDFRGVVAFGSSAFLMSSGTGELSRIYHTANLGKDWKLLFTNPDPKGFFDSTAFSDERHGLVVGDPVNGRFEILRTNDGGVTWTYIVHDMPAAVEGEGAFAASNSCIAMRGDNVWIITGGTSARVFRSHDGGDSWAVSKTPLMQGDASSGGFSIAFGDDRHGVIAGGDYRHPERGGSNLATTSDGGVTWKALSLAPQRFFSAVTYSSPDVLVLAGSSASAVSRDGLQSWQCFSAEGFNSLVLSQERDVIFAAGADGRIARMSVSGASCAKK